MENKQSFSSLIDEARERTSFLLLKQFSFRRWMTFLFIAWMAGALGGSSNLRLPSSSNRDQSKSTAASQATVQSDQRSEAAANPASSLAVSQPVPTAKKNPMTNPVIIGVIIAAVLFLVALMLLLGWLQARFRFVFLNAIINNSTEIVVPFRHFRSSGNSFFVFSLVLGLVSLLVILLESAPMIFFAIQHQPFHFLSFVKFSWPFFVLIVLTFIILSIVSVIIEDFMIPAMALGGSGWKEGWNDAFSAAVGAGGRFWQYVGVKILLGIVCGILAFLMALVVLLACLIAGVGVYFLFILMKKIHIVLVVFPVLIGIGVGLAAILLMLSIGLPFAVFFRTFSLLFFKSLKSEGFEFLN